MRSETRSGVPFIGAEGEGRRPTGGGGGAP
jgi:hypothetical protein